MMPAPRLAGVTAVCALALGHSAAEARDNAATMRFASPSEAARWSFFDLAMSERDVDLAYMLYADLHTHDADAATTWEALADLCLDGAACTKSAVAVLRKAIEFHPRRRDLVAALGLALAAAEGPSGGLSFLEGALSTTLVDTPVWEAWSRLLTQLPDELAISTQLFALAERYRTDGEVRARVIEEFWRRGQLSLVDEALAQAAQALADSPEVWALRGLRALERDDFQSAQAALAHAESLPALARGARSDRVVRLRHDIAEAVAERRRDFEEDALWHLLGQDSELHNDY